MNIGNGSFWRSHDHRPRTPSDLRQRTICAISTIDTLDMLIDREKKRDVIGWHKNFCKIALPKINDVEAMAYTASQKYRSGNADQFVTTLKPMNELGISLRNFVCHNPHVGANIQDRMIGKVDTAVKQPIEPILPGSTKVRSVRPQM
jgi:hypothetical protein